MFTVLLCHLIVATELFPSVNPTGATTFYDAASSKRSQPEILQLFGVRGDYFSEEGSDDTYKLKNSNGETIYRPYKENQLKNSGPLTGMTPLIMAIKTGGHRETMVRREDGTFAVFDTTHCPEKPASLRLNIAGN